jgi:hypothetical protein
MGKRKKGAIALEKGGPSSLFILSATNPVRSGGEYKISMWEKY